MHTSRGRWRMRFALHHLPHHVVDLKRVVFAGRKQPLCPLVDSQGCYRCCVLQQRQRGPSRDAAGGTHLLKAHSAVAKATEAAAAFLRAGDQCHASYGGSISAGKLKLVALAIWRRLLPKAHLGAWQVRGLRLPRQLDVGDLGVNPRDPVAVRRSEEEQATAGIVNETGDGVRRLLHLSYEPGFTAAGLPQGRILVHHSEELLGLDAIEDVAAARQRLQVASKAILPGLEILWTELPHHRLSRKLGKRRQAPFQGFVHDCGVIEPSLQRPRRDIVDTNLQQVFDVLPGFGQCDAGLQRFEPFREALGIWATVDYLILQNRHLHGQVPPDLGNVHSHGRKGARGRGKTAEPGGVQPGF
mmetsp:Transcript_32351/g.72675  ORF Transcript_32351/g.72675 Transcript_32351/m.72675 type:complete len:357 (+) Transcript_32351:911-1981(+)